MSDKQPVSVRILDREYRIACEPDERNSLIDAASYLDQQMRELKEAMSVPGVEKVAVLAALNITNELLQAQSIGKRFGTDVAERIHSLREKLDGGLPAKD